MNPKEEIRHLKAALKQSEAVQMELDRNVFYLRTLYDVSRDVYTSVETEKILRNFLLMAMGNFGSKRGFVILLAMGDKKIDCFESLGYLEEETKEVLKTFKKILNHGNPIQWFDTIYDLYDTVDNLKKQNLLPPRVEFLSTFSIEEEWQGFLGLGEKLMEEPYVKSDQELLDTLVNNLVIALKNAKSFEEIWALNKDLHDKNIELRKTLGELKNAVRKVEILESVKDNLSKFVPVTVSRMIEKSPTGNIPEQKRQDLSVLFLDIEGYTRLCEKLGSDEVNSIIEKHFSVFMDAIHSNRGDVNETAGDGLMVLFLDEDKKKNALNAVRAARTIQKDTKRIYDNIRTLYKPLEINMGINSGIALVGAAKFDSYTGSRWTYTARGDPVNIAARIGQMATGGSILISGQTSERLAGCYQASCLGFFKLKNISKEVEVFRLA
jgi:class 3 adenylate cyclase